MKIVKRIVFIGLLFFCNVSAVFAEENVSADIILKKCLEAYSTVNSYTCILHKTELIKNTHKEQNNIVFKFRKPLSLYLKWTKGSGEGTEVIYDKEKYGDKLKVHMGKLLKFVKLSVDPKGYLAMKGNRHSIFEAHIGYLIMLIKENYEKAKANNEGSISYEGEQMLGDRKVYLFKAIFPKDRGYYGGRILIYIDKDFYLPIKTETYGWDEKLWERYCFSNLKINESLFDLDFDVNNPNYGY